MKLLSGIAVVLLILSSGCITVNKNPVFTPVAPVNRPLIRQIPQNQVEGQIPTPPCCPSAKQ